MGGMFFQTVAKGKTPDEAFRTAAEQAAWDYGHAGYTGTIAEKPGFAFFGHVHMKPSEFMDVYRKVNRAFEELDSKQYLTEGEKEQLARLKKQKEEWVGKHPEGWTDWKTRHPLEPVFDAEQRIQYAARERGEAAIYANLPQEHKLITPKMRNVAEGDKWDEAACVQTGDDEFLFFGWASS